jgi:3-phosphoglycerate kinase
MPTEMKNYPIQGTGGEIVQMQLGLLWRHFVANKNYGGRALLCNTVHDCVWIDSQADVVHEVAADEMILDVGPAAVEALADVLKNCRTLVWNGPLGAFEIEPFDAATVSLARTAAALTREGSLVSVAGGGDTVAALAHAGVTDDFTFVSTAGGAFLEWMEGKPLPGVDALNIA